jgi:hypothetical protein
VVLAALATIAAGRWGLALFTTSECVHFSVNFPTAPGAEVMPVAALGGPWAMLPPEAWHGYPAGGLLVWGREGRIDVDLGRQGVLKDALQPWRVRLSTHWLRNVGLRPLRIRLELDACGMPVRWVTFERAWDPDRRVVTRPIEPRSTFNMDWILDVPRARRSQAVICDGELRVIEAGSDTVLTRLEILFRGASPGRRS